jgi:protein O-mannosyl-transferase
MMAKNTNPSRFQGSSALKHLLPWAVLILLMTVTAYVPAMQGSFIWDDNYYVTQNPTLRSFDGLRRIWLEPGATPQYYPLTFTSF